MAMTLAISSHTDVCSVFQLPHVKCAPHKTSVLIDGGGDDDIMTVQLSDKYAKSLKMVELTSQRAMTPVSQAHQGHK